MSDPLAPDERGEHGAPGADVRSADPGSADVAAARPYRAPDLDAPEYALPAYAAPEPGDAVDEHAIARAPGRYAPPSGYVIPAAGSPATRAGAPLPPYARDPATPVPARPDACGHPGAAARPDASGHPGATAYPGAAAYPGAPAYAGAAAYPGAAVYPGAAAYPGAGLPAAPGWPAPPGVAAYPVPAARDRRPKALAVIALVVAGAGVLLAFTPYLLGAFAPGWLPFLLLFAAFVLSIVALASRNQGGKGLAVGALLTSILGGVLAFALAVAWVFGSFASPDFGDADPDGDSGYEDYSVPGLAAPGTDGEPDPGAQFEPPVQVEVAETAFGRDYGDVWWYVVVVDNPNTDYVFDAFLDARAFDEDGAVVATGTTYTTLLSGRTAVVGYFTVDGGESITEMDVSVPAASTATLSPSAETGSFTVEGLAGAPDSTAGGTSTRPAPGTVTGTVSGRFADDQQYVAATVIARDAGGGIVAVSTTYLETVPGDGTPMPFEAWFAELPTEASFEAFAHR